MAEDNKNNFKVDFIGVGAPKCATSWTYKCLAEHPEICMGRPKEIHFFHINDPSGKADWKYEKGLDFYKSHFSHCEPNQIFGEFGPQYFDDPDVPLLIKKHFPNAKLIINLRNPVDKIFSHYNHSLSKNKKQISFEEIIENPEWIEKFTKFEHHLKRFFDNFPKENILINIYEDIEKDPVKFIQRIYKFVGADESYVPKLAHTHVNAAITRYSKKNKKIKRFIFRIYKFFKRLPVLNKLFIKLKNKGTGDKILGKIDETTVQKSSKPQMNPETREKLRKITAPEVKKVEELLGYRIEDWHK